MKYILLIFSLFILNACTQVDSQSDIVKVESLDPTDSDCDGVPDSSDICPGVDDTIDKNGDGKPDCKFPPGYANVDSTWKCSSPSLQKVIVQTKTPSGGFQEVCTYYSSVQTHINRGGFLGKKKSCNQ